MLDEFDDAAGIAKLVALHRVHALIGEDYIETPVKERQLAQPLRQGVVVALGGVHDGAVRLESNLGAGLAAGPAGLGQGSHWNPLAVILLPGKTFPPDFQV